MIIIKYLLISIFSSLLILCKDSPQNFNKNILRLVLAFVALAGSFPTSGSVAGSASSAGSVVAGPVGFSCTK